MFDLVEYGVVETDFDGLHGGRVVDKKTVVVGRIVSLEDGGFWQILFLRRWSKLDAFQGNKSSKLKSFCHEDSIGLAVVSVDVENSVAQFVVLERLDEFAEWFEGLIQVVEL